MQNQFKNEKNSEGLLLYEKAKRWAVECLKNVYANAET